MKRSIYSSLTEIKRLLAQLAFDPRKDLVLGAAQQAPLSPEYHRDRAIVLIRCLNSEPAAQTYLGRVKIFKLIFAHLVWWHLRTPCNTDAPKPEVPTDSGT